MPHPANKTVYKYAEEIIFADTKKSGTYILRSVHTIIY